MSIQSDFIGTIGPIIQREAISRGYHYPSAIISQACLESSYGQSRLASKYHNYFGLKCGSSWSGASVNLTTKEEYTAGTYTTIKDNFRVYDDMTDGVIGYFDFISKKRYQNLKDSVSPYDYLYKIKTDGYATSSQYVNNCYSVLTTYNLYTYDDSDDIIDTADLDDAINTFTDYVISGYFGNGHDRRKNAIYELIRKRVNERLKL